jgi:hypothetical protein
MTNTFKVWIYPGANPNLTPTSWGQFETDISQYVRRPGNDGGAPITYSWGKQDESTQTDAGAMNLTLDNRDGRFSTDKIDGPYYGLLDVNCPIRLGVGAGSDSFTRTVTAAVGPAAGWAGSWLNATTGGGTTTFSVDGSKGLINPTGANISVGAILSGASARDVDLVSSIVPTATATGASYGLGHMVRFTDQNNFVYSTLEFNTAGNVTIKIRRVLAGVTVELANVNPIASSSYSAGNAWMLRTQMDGDTMRLKAWPASGSEPGAWMLAADEGDNAGAGLGIFAIRFTGNTNTGAFIGLDSIDVTGLEWGGYVVSWPLQWDITGNNSWAPIAAGGILRRLRQGTNPVETPLKHQLKNYANVTGYWPMEEGSDAQYLTGTVAGTPFGTLNGAIGGQETSLAGGSQAPTITTAGGSIKVQAVQASGGTGFAGMVLFKLPSLPAAKTRMVRIRTSRGPAVIWDWSIDNLGGTTVDAYDDQFNSIGSSVNAAGIDFTAGWVALCLTTDNSGASTAWDWVYHMVGATAYFDQNGTVAGTTLSNILSMEFTGPVGTAFAHAWLGRNTLPFVTNAFSLVSSGYVGETAIGRFLRIAGEAGLANAVAGSAGTLSKGMGAQREGSTMAILQSCADADYGVLAERGMGIEFIPRNSRWNLASGLTLVKASGHIAEVPKPVRDDQRLRNKWTITRQGGSSGTFQNDASVARNGTWEDSATLNVTNDADLVNQAAWRVAIGVQSRLRWPQIALNLSRNPSLAFRWRSRYYGWRFKVTTGLLQVTGNEPDLIMEGFQASLDPDQWVIEMNATDARVWVAGVTDDTGILGRADHEFCTTTALINSTTLSIPITTAGTWPKWDNTAGLWSGGVDFNVGGEQVTVTSITNGAGQAQTLNATVRGVNGYAAIHASGAPVSLWNPAMVAL